VPTGSEAVLMMEPKEVKDGSDGNDQPVKTAKHVVLVKDAPDEVAADFRKCWRACRLFR